jgi:hypothetical protein
MYVFVATPDKGHAQKVKRKKCLQLNCYVVMSDCRQSDTMISLKYARGGSYETP